MITFKCSTLNKIKPSYFIASITCGYRKFYWASMKCLIYFENVQTSIILYSILFYRNTCCSYVYVSKHPKWKPNYRVSHFSHSAIFLLDCILTLLNSWLLCYNRMLTEIADTVKRTILLLVSVQYRAVTEKSKLNSYRVREEEIYCLSMYT